MDEKISGVVGLGSERVLYPDPVVQSRAALVSLRYALSLQDPTAGYLGWLAFRSRVLTQWLEERGVLVCVYCGKSPLLIEGPKREIATIDHVIPLSKKGKRFDLSNLVVACHSCNGKKADKNPEDFPCASK